VVELPPGVIARNVNGDGSIIVGTGPSAGGALQWTEDAGIESLFVGRTPTWAWDISSDGSVILGQDDESVFAWSETDAFTSIEGTTDAFGAGMTILSDNGQVVVGSDFLGPDHHDRIAFHWTKDSGLNHLGPLPDGKRTRSATGVSADGSIIVGNSEFDVDHVISLPGTSIGLLSEPFIWDQTHGVRYLFDVLRDEYGLADALAGWHDFATVRGVSGDGRTIVGLGLNPDGNGEGWVAYLGPSTASLPGDYNADGTVDAADYVAWRGRDGTQQEYETWRAHFGQTAGDASARVAESAAADSETHVAEFLRNSDSAVRRGGLPYVAVPEPGTLVFAGMAVFLFAWPLRRRAGAIVMLVISGWAACCAPAAAQPHVLKWDIQATVYSITDPHNVFPDLRLGDTVRGTLAYNLNSDFIDFESEGSGVYVHGPTFPVTEMVIENPRTGVDLEFRVDESMQESQVFMLNDWQDFGWPEHADRISTSQPVLVPVEVPDGVGDGFGLPILEVLLHGPVDTIPSGQLPLELNLDDWPLADISFYDNWIYDISDTRIEAQIYSLTPVTFESVAGDFDADADADERDYAIWRSNFGSTEFLDADADGSGVIDAADYVVWRHQAGPHVAESAVADSDRAARRDGLPYAAVPEPSTLVAALSALLPFGFRRRRYRNAAGRHTLRLPLPQLFAAALLAGVSAEFARAQQPFFMGLGDLPGGPFFSWATDVSYDGSVVTGWSFIGDPNSKTDTDAFHWSRGTGMIGLGAISDYFNDVRISADGSTIIGNIAVDGAAGDIAFRWKTEAGLIKFPAEVWIANGVNGDGSIIVGQAPQFDPDLQAIKWTESSGVEPLFVGRTNTLAYDISADGSVILGRHGRGFPAGGSLLIENAQEGTTLIEHGSDISSLAAVPEISDNGKVVVGSFGMNQPDSGRAFRWTKEGGVHYLGPFPDGKRTAFARGVSADGSIIVGSSEVVAVEDFITTSGGVTVAREPFIWDEVRGSRYLFDVLRNEYGLGAALAGWSDLALASAISGDGRTIVGLGVNPDGNGEAWIAYLGPPAAQLPGDFNADGTVDAADYVVWRDGGGTPQEYETWRAHFGQIAAAAASSRSSVAVPEPTSMPLMLLIVSTLLRRLGFRRKTGHLQNSIRSNA
jgi:probable HAF family extracellular repeat protein